MDNPLTTIFSFVGTFYGLVLPLLLVLALSVLYIPSMLSPGAKAQGIGEAIYCFAMQIIGILLMTLGALPTVFSVFAGIAFTGRTYIGLLVVFACGGILFLMHETMAHELDPASKAVPEAITFFTIKIFGNVLAILSALSILLAIITGSTQAGWWVMPFVLFFYGLLLAWCTRSEREMKVFKSSPIAPKAGAASPMKKAAQRMMVKKRGK